MRRPHLLRVRATDAEAAERLPGDDLIAVARYRSTHGITIDAPAADIWPWLAQMGQGRGGLYSYDWLENLVRLDIHSADHIDPALQHVSMGDTIRLVPEGSEPPLHFVVAQAEAPLLLVLGPDGTLAEAVDAHLPHPSWTFQLVPVGATSCRLLVRFQCDFDPTRLNHLAYKYGLRPVHFVMERKMMLGIKKRAEAAA